MVNWKDIHQDFENSSKLISEWEELGLNYSECKEWIEAGLEPQDARYAFWLKEASEESGSKTERIDNKNSIELIDSKGKEDLYLGISEIKEKKHWGMIIQSLVKMLRNKNKLIEELRSSRKTPREYQWEKIGKGNRLVKSKKQTDEEITQPQVETYLLERKNQQLQEELVNQRKHIQCRIQELNRQLSDRERELKEILQENEELKISSSDSLKKSSVVDENSEVFEILWKKCEDLENENKVLKEKLGEVRQKELRVFINNLKSKLDEDSQEDLNDLLEAQAEFSKNNNPYVEKQLEKSKKRLLREEKLTEQELINICELQNELAKLKIETENKLENTIEITRK